MYTLPRICTVLLNHFIEEKKTKDMPFLVLFMVNSIVSPWWFI